MCLNTGLVYNRVRFGWVSLDGTLVKKGAQKSGFKFSLCVTPALDRAEYSLGVSP